VFVDQAGGLWLTGPAALVVALAAVLIVLWADGGFKVRRTGRVGARSVRRRKGLRFVVDYRAAWHPLKPVAWQSVTNRPSQRVARNGTVARRRVPIPAAVPYRPSFSSARTA